MRLKKVGGGVWGGEDRKAGVLGGDGRLGVGVERVGRDCFSVF